MASWKPKGSLSLLGFEDGKLETEGQLVVGLRVAHRLIRGDGARTARLHLVDEVDVLVERLVTVGHTLRLKGGIARLERLGELGAGQAGERVCRTLDVAEVGVLGDACERLVLVVIAVEQLGLAIGAQNAAQEREEEHEGKDEEADHGHAVAEEPLDDEHRGGKRLDATVVVEGVALGIRHRAGVLRQGLVDGVLHLVRLGLGAVALVGVEGGLGNVLHAQRALGAAVVRKAVLGENVQPVRADKLRYAVIYLRVDMIRTSRENYAAGVVFFHLRKIFGALSPDIGFGAPHLDLGGVRRRFRFGDRYAPHFAA